jgi:monoamine oxidase
VRLVELEQADDEPSKVARLVHNKSDSAKTSWGFEVGNDSERLSRRRFLKLAGGASAGALAAAGLPLLGKQSGAEPVPSAGDLERVIVVGAGFAGLACAAALRDAGVDVVVLEARNRIGGRVLTVDVGGAPVDLGAAWIHTPIGNPMSDLAQELGVGTIPAGFVEQLGNFTAYDALLGDLGPGQIFNAFQKTVQFERQLPALRAALGPDASVDGGIELFLDNAGLTGTPRRHADFAIRLLAENTEGAVASDLRLNDYLTTGIEYIGQDVFPDGGYSQLIDGLAVGLDVRKRQSVSEITCKPDGVEVWAVQRRSRPGGGCGTPWVRHEGSHVIVTVPLGVLKANAISFTPALPDWKLGAIQRLGYGSFEKVIMRFAEPFWLGNRRHFFYLPPEGKDLPIWLDYSQFYAGEPVLEAITGGPYALTMKDLPTREVKARAVAILREVFGGPVPTPAEVRITRWGKDGYSRGAYSYLAVGSAQADLGLLAAPVGDRLGFAGEATSSTRWGFTDGALDSGRREAQRLLGAPLPRSEPQPQGGETRR